ncbi:MAG: ATP-binding protein [Acidobacteriota bacterium]
MECCNEPAGCVPEKEPLRIQVEGIPESVPKGVAEICRARLVEAVEELLELSAAAEVRISVGNAPAPKETRSRSPVAGAAGGSEDVLTLEERAAQYQSRQPFFDFDFLVVSDELQESLLSAMDLVQLEGKVFDQWNLKAIEPFPRTALNFHGPPGTGKTLAAHALASYIDSPILMANYGQIESKYVGDGAKNVEAIFFAAERDQAVLFIDESDSLLSRRLTNVTQGAEQAINSMRSQLLVCLEQFKGIVIFSTNLVENYDKGFETRVRNLYFPMPDEECRRRIWTNHLPRQLPLAPDVSVNDLARMGDLCGRDIKNAVIDAALRAARSGQDRIGHSDLVRAVDRVKSSRVHHLSPVDRKAMVPAF